MEYALGAVSPEAVLGRALDAADFEDPWTADEGRAALTALLAERDEARKTAASWHAENYAERKARVAAESERETLRAALEVSREAIVELTPTNPETTDHAERVRVVAERLRQSADTTDTSIQFLDEEELAIEAADDAALWREEADTLDALAARLDEMERRYETVCLQRDRYRSAYATLENTRDALLTERDAAVKERDEAMDAVGLPRTASLDELIRHHRENAGLAVGFDVVAAEATLIRYRNALERVTKAHRLYDADRIARAALDGPKEEPQSEATSPA